MFVGHTNESRHKEMMNSREDINLCNNNLISQDISLAILGWRKPFNQKNVIKKSPTTNYIIKSCQNEN